MTHVFLYSRKKAVQDGSGIIEFRDSGFRAAFTSMCLKDDLPTSLQEDSSQKIVGAGTGWEIIESPQPPKPSQQASKPAVNTIS